MSKYCLWGVIGVTLLLCRCMAPNAGGTTDTDNAKVLAVIHTKDGGRAANVPVTVCPIEYFSGVGADSSSKREQYVTTIVTDDTGFFRIDSIAAGEYSIEVNDGEANAVLLNIAISVSKNAQVTVEDTMYPYVIVHGHLDSIKDTSINRYCVIYGLERKIPIESDGSFKIDNLPAGIFHFSIISESEDWPSIDIENVEAHSDSTVTVVAVDTSNTLPHDTPPYVKVTLNTSGDGADVSDDVIDFPVLVRLNGDNFIFSEVKGDGSDIRFVKSDGIRLPFEIEEWDSTAQTAAIWVLVDTVYGGNDSQFFMMHYGVDDSMVSEGMRVFDTANGFLAGYHLNGSLDDITVNGYDGIDSGTVDAEDGIIAHARKFNGISQFFTIGDLPDRQKGTISFWFRLNEPFSTSKKTQGIWGKKIHNEYDFSISLRATDFYSGLDPDVEGALLTKLENEDAGYYLSSSVKTFNDNRWYYVVWSWGEDENSMYINGGLEATILNSLPIDGDAYEEIGRCQYDTANILYGGPRYFKGTLDEFRIENVVRNSDWVKLCYINQLMDNKLVTLEVIKPDEE
jgi:hypothetical protein